MQRNKNKNKTDGWLQIIQKCGQEDTIFKVLKNIYINNSRILNTIKVIFIWKKLILLDKEKNENICWQKIVLKVMVKGNAVGSSSVWRDIIPDRKTE